nr:PAS domain S-box protein [Variovorax boronicumulans]
MRPFDVVDLLKTQLPDAAVLTGADGVVAYWSTGAQTMYGYTPEEAVDRDIASLIVSPAQAHEHAQRLREALELGQVTFESVRRRRDGSLLYADVSAKRVSVPGETETLLMFVEKDVTPIKVLRDARLMEARFRDLLESTPDGIVLANPTGHIVIANSQAERLFGYTAGELLGKSVDALLPERYRKAHVGHRANYLFQPRKRAMGSGLDLAGRRKDGSEFPIEISLSPLHTEESAFVMSAIRDISERKNFEKALQEKNLELASANQAKDRFLASMSHELRTPLNAIIGFTGTLLMRLPGPLTGDQEKQLRTVQGSARHLLALINDLLDVAKIEAGKIELHPEPVDGRTVLEEVAAALRPQAELKGLAFALDLPAQVRMLHTDRRALSQIVINLTSNAIKFTQTGAVRLSLVQQDLERGGRTDFVVEDTGEGIAPADQAKLFGAFSRIEQRRGPQPEGTGLGLHLSRKLAIVLGGDILVDSEPGRGSRFTLALPEA